MNLLKFIVHLKINHADIREDVNLYFMTTRQDATIKDP